MNHAAAIAEIHALMERLEPEPVHTRHVAMLAIRLFDETRAFHALGLNERVILEGAGCLHDIGWPVSRGGSGHHKHSARVIRAQKWVHLEPVEVEMLALVARYHRKALPSSEHVDFHRLPPSRQATVRTLASLLRVADALDRSHLQEVRDAQVRLTDRHLEITLVSRRPPAREFAAALRKGNLAALVFGRELVFRYEPLDRKR